MTLLIRALSGLLGLTLLTSAQKCSVTRRSDPGVEEGLPCVFPFTYKGETFMTCTARDQPGGQEWCSTKVDGSGVHVSGGGHWGVCGQGCPRDPRCPQGWTELDTGCYKLMEDTRVTKPEAEEVCQAAGGYIVEIESREELDALNAWYKASVETQCMFDSDIIWLGIHNETNFSDGAGNVWKSDRTGEPVSFKYWLDSEPNYGGDNERCAGFFPNSYFSNQYELKQFGWFDYKCDGKGFDIKWEVNMRALCERDVQVKGVIASTASKKEEAAPTFGPDGCYKKVGDSCYMFKDMPATYREAKKYCSQRGGHLVELETKEEYEMLEQEWERVEAEDNGCDTFRGWWIGVNDLEKEGEWVSDRTGKSPSFTKWNKNEPNNYGEIKVPGEDCAVAHLWAPNFNWYDVPCKLRGFPIDEKRGGVTFNPLCEHEPSQEETDTFMEGLDQEWVSIGEESYKFVKTPYGVTRDEAKEICQANGGILAEILNEDQRKGLQTYFEANLLPKPQSYFLAALDFISGKRSEADPAYWVGASDERREGAWVWERSGRNVTDDSPWYFFGRGELGVLNMFGDDDCGMIVHKNGFLNHEDWGENEKYRAMVEEGESFKMMGISCYTRVLKPDYFNFIMSPLCQKLQ